MKYRVDERIIWHNGSLVKVGDAKMSVLCPSAQFGLNVFEGVPCYYNEHHKNLYIFRLKDHYERLKKSAGLLEIDFPYTYEEVERALKAVLVANEYKQDCMARIMLYVDGSGSWNCEGPTGLFIAPIHRERKQKSLNCMVSGYQRISDKVMSPTIKCGANYINSRMGHREAVKKGYDTCIFLNDKGSVSEGAGSCFFLVKDGEVVTPTLADSVLNSITRGTVLTLAKKLGYTAAERSIAKNELYSADEAFLCGSAVEITPIVSIDKWFIENGEGKVTENLTQSYMKVVRGEDEEYHNWLTAVYDGEGV